MKKFVFLGVSLVFLFVSGCVNKSNPNKTSVYDPYFIKIITKVKEKGGSREFIDSLDKVIQYHKKDNDAQTLFYLNRAIEANPDHAELFVMLAHFSSSIQYDKVIQDFTDALQKDPQNAEIYFNRGLTYFIKAFTMKLFTILVKA